MFLFFSNWQNLIFFFTFGLALQINKQENKNIFNLKKKGKKEKEKRKKQDKNPSLEPWHHWLMPANCFHSSVKSWTVHRQDPHRAKCIILRKDTEGERRPSPLLSTTSQEAIRVQNLLHRHLGGLSQVFGAVSV